MKETIWFYLLILSGNHGGYDDMNMRCNQKCMFCMGCGINFSINYNNCYIKIK